MALGERLGTPRQVLGVAIAVVHPVGAALDPVRRRRGVGGHDADRDADRGYVGFPVEEDFYGRGRLSCCYALE